MKKYILILLTLFVAFEMSALSPAESFVKKYEDLKGVRCIQVAGAKMRFARPVLKRYPIGPMSDCVNEVIVLNMEKASEQDKSHFIKELHRVLRQYEYVGKSDSPNGEVDVYLNLESPDYVDEIVIYNPELMTVNVLAGKFPVPDLKKIQTVKR